MIGLVDYGAGNLRSVEAALGRAGASWRTVTRPDDLRGIDRLVLPGVGRFAAAAARLREARLDEALRSWVRSGRPLLGICLGLQLLFETSEEDPGIRGLAILPGAVERLATERVPHIGWARVVPIPRGDGATVSTAPFDAWFAHSFAVPADSPHAVARADAPVPFAAAVARASVTGVQFHPEKSGPLGQALVAAFAAGRSPAAPVADAVGPRPLPPASPGRMRRIIACLDVRGGRIVKGVRFRNLKDAGNPVERAEVYDREGADEICLLDVSATVEERRPLAGLVSAVAGRLTVPLSVGGGVRDLEEMRRLLLAGADRVSLGSAAVTDPHLLNRAARAFGSQFVIVSIDARRSATGWEVMTHGGGRATGRDAVAWAREAADRGAGEILLNAMDADGMRAGYDIALTRRVTEVVRVPVIASGGAGSALDMARVLREGGADAALAASIFHDDSTSVRDVKRVLTEAGVAVRP